MVIPYGTTIKNVSLAIPLLSYRRSLMARTETWQYLVGGCRQERNQQQHHNQSSLSRDEARRPLCRGDGQPPYLIPFNHNLKKVLHKIVLNTKKTNKSRQVVENEMRA